MLIPMSSLHNLPLGAGYSKRKGRSQVKLTQRPNGVLEITSHCDSIEVLVNELTIENERLTREIQKLQAQLNTKLKKASSPSLPRWPSSWTMILLLLALSIVVKFRNPIKTWSRQLLNHIITTFKQH